ncbi:MAG: ATP-binding protein [Myxococcales bacterium]|nr:ATP-binding protein [Myxococcales bacterium]MCB9735979.1 ATP-binding protein [Deltaproteobacteria bacterium]
MSALGLNLTSAWHELKNRPSAEWGATLDLVRLGLGDHVDTVVVALDPGSGHGALYLKLTSSDDPIPAANLSDGQLTWLAYVAMARLGGDRSLLAIDEPELRLHPALLGRVMGLLTDLPGSPQVVIGTHSDRVLAMLDDPADAVRVCSLEGGKAVVSRLDPAELPRWLDEFGDLGQLRASGYLDRVVAEPAPTDE